MSNVLNVFLHDKQIGTLVQPDQDTGNVHFEPASDAQDTGEDTAVLSLGDINSMRIQGDALNPESKLPPFFANLLPSGEYHHWLCELFGIKEDDSFLFLSIYGGNLFGAVQVLPLPSDDPNEIDMLEEIKKGKFPQPWQYMALPGKHIKLPLTRQDDQFAVATNPLTAPFYLQIVDDKEPCFVDNVYLMSHLANAIGIATPACFKVNAQSIQLPENRPGTANDTFIVLERIDRDNDTGCAIHCETMAQALGVTTSMPAQEMTYEKIVTFIQERFHDNERMQALQTFITQLVFHILVGNAQADLTRFAIIYRDGKTPQLAPLLQPISTLLYSDAQALPYALGGIQSFDKITLDTLCALSEHCDLDEASIKETVMDIVKQASECWPAVISNFTVPEALYQALHRHWEVIADNF